MSLLRRRAPHRSCLVHGDNGCEIQGEAGTRERHHERWRDEAEEEAAAYVSRLWAEDWDSDGDSVYDSR